MREEGFIVHELPALDEQRLQQDGDYFAWLGVSQFQAELMAYILNENADD